MTLSEQSKLALTDLEARCREFIKSEILQQSDSAHDLEHISRVVKNSKLILQHEEADSEVVIAASWLHDCVIVSKDHPDRSRASALAAEKAGEFLLSIDFTAEKIENVKHAIQAHSFSARIEPKSIEAKIVQDADRLDAIGAIGIARCLMVGGNLDRPLYNPDDPWCDDRDPDDGQWTIDHFFQKLFKLPDTMRTNTAKQEAVRRISFMKEFLQELKKEI